MVCCNVINMQILMINNSLISGKTTYRCAGGKNGSSPDKAEGDKMSPIGTFPLRRVFYRPDKVPAPETKLPVVAITPHMGWCDDPTCPEYNTLIDLPFTGNHEKMWRDDDAYDLVVEVGYNDDPIIPGKGSAVFMHCTKDYRGTEGCVALSVEDLQDLLKDLSKESLLTIAS